MVLFLGLILLATSWWAGIKLEWLNDFFSFLLYFIILLVLAWNYKIHAKWLYCNNDIQVLFYFNIFGYQQIIIETNGSTFKKKWMSYKPQNCSFKNGLSLVFSRINQELGGFGLHLTQNGKVLTPDHIEKQ
jgi:hypothetical protein